MQEITVTAVGNLTKDPEVTEVNNTTKAEIVLASTPSQIKDGQWTDLPTVFTTVVFWGGPASAAAQYRSGALLVVRGVMRAREYESDGQQRRFQYVKGQDVGLHVADRSHLQSQNHPRSDAETARPGDNASNWGGNPSGDYSAPYGANTGASRVWGQQ